MSFTRHQAWTETVSCKGFKNEIPKQELLKDSGGALHLFFSFAPEVSLAEKAASCPFFLKTSAATKEAKSFHNISTLSNNTVSMSE